MSDELRVPKRRVQAEVLLVGDGAPILAGAAAALHALVRSFA